MIIIGRKQPPKSATNKGICDFNLNLDGTQLLRAFCKLFTGHHLTRYSKPKMSMLSERQRDELYVKIAGYHAVMT
jgi:hypothetical protein